MAKIAISYRRADSQDITGRIFDRLVEQYGKNTVFRDIDNMRPGIDYRVQISEALKTTDVLLVVLGPKWLGRDEAGGRIDNAADLVRIEVETALKRGIPIIPVLVGGMKMPNPTDLPRSLADLAYREAVTVDSGRDFDHHIARLIRSLDTFFASRAVAPPQSVAPNGAATAPAHSGEAPANSAKEPMARKAAEVAPTRLRSPLIAACYIVSGLVIVALLGMAAVQLREPTTQRLANQQTSPPVATAVHTNPFETAAVPNQPLSEAASAWAVTKDATSIAELNDFIRQFGDTPYGSMARARLRELQQMPATANAQVPAANSIQQAPVQTTVSPSFDCSKSYAPDELEICRNAQLALFDRQIDSLFRALRSRLNHQEQAKLVEGERAWLKQRAACYNDDACLRDAYVSRINQLRSWQ